jgi:cell division protein FtsB
MVNWAQIKSKIPACLRSQRAAYVLIILFFLMWVVLFDDNSVMDWAKSRLKISQMKHEKAYYEQQLKTTTEILQELRTNNDSLEKFARERYGFHNPDEDVFVVVE